MTKAPMAVATFVLCLLMLVGLGGCGGGAESLSDCREDETGYEIRLKSNRIDCEQASVILGLLGSAEHGVQTITEGKKTWLCRAYPTKTNAPKYICRQGGAAFVVWNPEK